jgi:formate hydrogenlyase transcriptional activator
MSQRVGDGESDAEILLRLAEATAHALGVEFFAVLVRQLCEALGAPFAFVAEFADAPSRVRSLAYWANGQLEENFEYDLSGTPCEAVARGDICHHPRDVARKFPGDSWLADIGAQSYLGVPLRDASGTILGHLALMDSVPMPEEPRRLAIFRIFGARAAAELQRVRMERALAESERRFRDLFEEAPIGYVYEDTDTRFLSANHAFQQMLGLRPEEVSRTMGLSLVAPTEETRAKVQDSLEAERAGQEKPFIEIELRRKDDGRPVYVQRFSRPEPDGRYTRTMVVDITARVLAEQERNRLRAQNEYLQEEIKSEYNFEEIVGRSPSLRTALAKVKQVAPMDATALILGETGTGKELIARAIHNASRRRDRPLIKLNCAALPTGLIESELFGHEKGAFTGALERRVGRFALADGGTIFLDEIGEISHETQLRLLRVLQELEFEPVGSSKTVKVDVRVIAATNRDLEKAVADGAFRADLFYRLNVFPIHVPPLRERRGDIPMLTRYFVEKYAMKVGRRIDSIKSETVERLEAYPWPGNVRELENVVERAVILSPGTELEVDAMLLRPPPAPAPAAASGEAVTGKEGPATLDHLQRQHIVKALEQCGWRIEGPRGAAVMLGLHPNTLRSRMKKLGLRRAQGGGRSH